MEIGKQEPFEKTFYLKKYNVTVTQNSVVYFQDKAFIKAQSVFRNRYEEQTGKIVIKNIYLRFNSSYQHEYEKMFDVLAYAMDINKHLGF